VTRNPDCDGISQDLSTCDYVRSFPRKVRSTPRAVQMLQTAAQQSDDDQAVVLSTDERKGKTAPGPFIPAKQHPVRFRLQAGLVVSGLRSARFEIETFDRAIFARRPESPDHAHRWPHVAIEELLLCEPVTRRRSPSTSRPITTRISSPKRRGSCGLHWEFEISTKQDLQLTRQAPQPKAACERPFNRSNPRTTSASCTMRHQRLHTSTIRL
jgi:hypothetical protein